MTDFAYQQHLWLTVGILIGMPLLWIVAVYVTILEQRWRVVKAHIDKRK